MKLAASLLNSIKKKIAGNVEKEIGTPIVSRDDGPRMDIHDSMWAWGNLKVLSEGNLQPT